jgi:hypothetical protein
MEEKKVLITDRFISIPPKVSVSWREITSLYMRDEGLHLLLKGGELVVLHDLSDEMIDKIFHHHALHLDRRAEERHREVMGPLGRLMQLPEGTESVVRIGFAPLDAMGMMVQHNPDQKDAPPLPNDLIEKISGVLRLLSPDDPDALPKPEGNCYCFHCQIARSIQPAAEKDEEIDEEINPSELSFSDWEVQEAGDKLFSVTNKLNKEERYSVYLGTPVGCTCGRENCEHIVSVLKS